MRLRFAMTLLAAAILTGCGILGGGFDPSHIRAPAVLLVQDETGKPVECVHIDGDDILIVRVRRLEGASLQSVLDTVDCKTLSMSELDE